jgi:putative flippase GtrA
VQERPPVILVLGGLFANVVVILGIAIGIGLFAPSDDFVRWIGYICAGELAWLVYLGIAWTLKPRPEYDPDKLYGMKVGPFRMNDPFSFKDNVERNYFSLQLLLMPGYLMAISVALAIELIAGE